MTKEVKNKLFTTRFAKSIRFLMAAALLTSFIGSSQISQAGLLEDIIKITVPAPIPVPVPVPVPVPIPLPLPRPFPGF